MGGEDSENDPMDTVPLLQLRRADAIERAIAARLAPLAAQEQAGVLDSIAQSRSAEPVVPRGILHCLLGFIAGWIAKCRDHGALGERPLPQCVRESLEPDIANLVVEEVKLLHIAHQTKHLRVRLKTLDFFLCVVTHLLSVQHTRISFFASRQHLDARAALVGLVATASRRPDCSQSGVVRPASSLSDRATTIGARARALTDTRRCASVP